MTLQSCLHDVIQTILDQPIAERSQLFSVVDQLLNTLNNKKDLTPQVAFDFFNISNHSVKDAVKKFYQTNDTILIVSHTGVIADYLRNYFDDNYLKQKSEYFSKYYSVKSCSITIVEVKNNKKQLIELGSVKHLLSPASPVNSS